MNFFFGLFKGFFFPQSFNTVLTLILHLTHLVFFNRVVLCIFVWHPALLEHFPTSQSNFHFKHISWTLTLFYKSTLMFCLWFSRQGAFCLFVCFAGLFSPLLLSSNEESPFLFYLFFLIGELIDWQKDHKYLFHTFSKKLCDVDYKLSWECSLLFWNLICRVPGNKQTQHK